jgi:hypothetical protein
MLRIFWDVLPCSSLDVNRRVRAMMEAAHTSETLVDIQLRTWQYIPDDSDLDTQLDITTTSKCTLFTHSLVIW